MAGHTVGRPRERGRRRRASLFGLGIAGLFLCIGAFSQAMSSEPIPDEPTQWKQSIERPSRRWDYDGKRILGHIGYDICLWDATDGELLHRMKGHKERIYAVQFSPDGNHALSSSWQGPGPMVWYVSKDTRTILWNLGTGRRRDSFENQVAGEFSPNGRLIVTFSQRPSKIKPEWGKMEITSTGETWPLGIAGSFDFAVWETFTGRQLVKAKLDENSYPDRVRNSLYFSADGRSFVHFGSGVAMLYNTGDGREIGRIDPTVGDYLRYTSKVALASFEPTKARLIDLESGRVVRSIPHDLKHIWGTAWTHDGSRFAAIPYGEGEITIGDLESGKMTTGAKTHPKTGNRVIVSPDNRRLAIQSGSDPEDKPDVRFYDMHTGKEIAKIKFARLSHMIGFSPDSKTFLVGGPEFIIYNSENGEKIRALKLLEDDDLSERQYAPPG